MPQYDKFGVARSREGYVTASTITNLIGDGESGSGTKFRAELNKVFKEANRRLDALTKIKGYSELPAAIKLDKMLDENLIKYNTGAEQRVQDKKSKNYNQLRLFKVDKQLNALNVDDAVRAYKVALDFISMPTSDPERAAIFIEKGKNNIRDVLQVGLETMALKDKSFRGDDYSTIAELEQQAIELVTEEHKEDFDPDNPEFYIRYGSVVKRVELDTDDDVLSQIGKSLNAARDLLKDVGITGSPTRESNRVNEIQDRLVDILAKYMLGKDYAGLTMEERVQAAVDEFADLQKRGKAPEGTSEQAVTQRRSLASGPRKGIGSIEATPVNTESSATFTSSPVKNRIYGRK